MLRKEKPLKHKTIYKGKILNFCVDEILLPNEKKQIREYTQHPGAVTILPFLTKNKIILVRQYRYPVKKFLYELPAGKITPGENCLACVKRELIEETGYKPGYIKKLVSFYPTPAFSDEILHIYLAKDLKPSKDLPDEDEFIDRIVVNFDEAVRWVFNGKISDAKSIIGILFFKYKK